MEKQLTFFGIEENDDFPIWPCLPKKTQQRIETILAKLLVKHLSSSLEEVKDHEK